MTSHSSTLRGVRMKPPVRTALSSALLLALTGNAFAVDVTNQSQYDAALLAGGAITVTSSFGINAMPGNPIGGNVTLSGALANPDAPLLVIDGGGGTHHAFTNWASSSGLVLLENLAIENFGNVAIYNLSPGIYPPLSIDNARFVGNVNTAGMYHGGAVASNEVGSISHSTFIGNSAGDSDGGGAVYASSINSVKHSRFVGNTGKSGGAIFAFNGIGAIEDSTFINNRAHDDYEGGALTIGGDASIKNSVFLGNSVQGGNSSGGAIFHVKNGGTASLTIDADAGSETLFYGNRDGNGYNAIHLAGTATTTVNVGGAGTVVMLDPMSASATLTTQVGAIGDWVLGGVSSLDGESVWNIHNGELVLTDVRYGVGNPTHNAAINLNHANSSFTLGAAGTLGGAGSIKAASIVLNGLIAPASFTVTGPAVADLGNDDALAQVSTESSPFGTLALEGDVTMTGATVMVNASESAQSKLDITGDLTLTGANTTVRLNFVDDTAGAMSNVTVIDVTGSIDISAASFDIANTQGYLKTSGGAVTVVGNEVQVSINAPTQAWNDLTQTGGKYDAHGTFDVAYGTTFTVTGVLADHVNTDASQSNTGWDGKSLTKKGDGTLILNAANTYTGTTTVEDGELTVGSAAGSTASVAGLVHVENDAVIGGHGTLAGGLTLAADAIVAPGTTTSTGTLSVTGNVDLGTALLDIKVNPDGSHDKLAVSGTAKIANASLDINSGGGAGVWAANTSYTILEAAGGLGGEQFDDNNVMNTLAFLDHKLDYTDPNKVELTLTRNNATYASFAGTSNQRGVANAIAALGNGHAVNPAVTGLDAADVASAYDNLSGEIYGSVRSALLGNTRLRGMVQARMQGLGRQELAAAPVLLASNGAAPRVNLNTPSQRLWVNTWAYDGDTKGSRNAAKTDQSGIGLALGGDVRVADGVTVGAMFGYEDGKVKNGGTRRSRTDVDAYSLGGYATADLGGVELQGGLIYSHMKLDANRTITVTGLTGKAKASYDGYKVQAFMEAGLPLELGEATVTPYANLTQTWLHTDAAREKGSAAALRIGAQNDSVTQTTLGLRATYQLPTAAPVALTAHLGWAHAFGDTKAKTSNRFGTSGSRFAIEGNRMDRDRALIGVGIEAQLAPNATLAVGYDGQFGSKTKDHAGNVQVRVKF